MTLRSFLTFALAAACAGSGLSACNRDRPQTVAADRGTALRIVHRLTCPQHSGSLTLVSTAPDGRDCAYQGAGGAQVRLRLVPLDGETPEHALAPIEAELRARLPARHPEGPAAETADEVSGDNVNINLPGIDIDADDGGANIRIGGMHVNADQDGAQVSVDSGGGDEAGPGPVVRRTSGRGDVVIDADGSGAEVRVSAPGRGVRMTYILASSEPGPGGDRFVAYEARGPASGPLVVATLRAPAEHRGGPLTAAKRLVRQNVGG